MTVLDLICRAMRFIGALEPGAPPEAAEAQDVLCALNAMVDAWGTERLMVWQVVRNLFSLAPGLQVYEIGLNTSAPNWVAPRPVSISGAGILLSSDGGVTTFERPIRVLTDGEYRAIRVKGLPSTFPTALYYDYGFSNPDPAGKGGPTDIGSGNIFVWPCPSVSNQIALYTPQVVGQFTALTQQIALPPGYARALASNLAVEIAPEFQATPSQTVVAIALESKENIMRNNYRPHKLRTDRALRPKQGGFDYLIGEVV